MNSEPISALLDPGSQSLLKPPTEHGDWLMPATDRLANEKQKENDWLALALRRRSPYDDQRV